MRTPEERLAAGLKAYARLQGAFDPSGDSIADLRASGVSERRISALYPLDFAAYLPQLQALLGANRALAKQVVEACYARGKLSMSRIDLAGLELAGLEEFDEQFDSLTSDAMNALFETALTAYTEDGKSMPMPSPMRTEWEQAHMEVQYLMVNFRLSAWLLAHWKQASFIEEPEVWMDGELNVGLRHDILDVTLGFFENIWEPLIQAASDTSSK